MLLKEGPIQGRYDDEIGGPVVLPVRRRILHLIKPALIDDAKKPKR